MQTLFFVKIFGIIIYRLDKYSLQITAQIEKTGCQYPAGTVQHTGEYQKNILNESQIHQYKHGLIFYVSFKYL